MGWRVGDGKKIRLGVDPVASLNMSFVLPEDLRMYLKEFGIMMLNHAHNLGIGTSSHSYWLFAEDINLGGC